MKTVWRAWVVVLVMLPSVWVSAQNLVENADFEAPANGENKMPAEWHYYVSGQPSASIVEGQGRGGSQCVLLDVQGAPNSGQGFMQTLQVTPGKKYDFEVYVKNCGSKPLNGSAFGQLVIEWLDEAGREGGRSMSEPWGKGLSRTGWKKIYIHKAEAPEYATEAKFGIHLFDGDGGADGAFLVDDVRVRER